MVMHADTSVGEAPDPAGRAGPEPLAGAGQYEVLNPRYPSSYYLVAYSDDVRKGGVVPLTVLERKVILWRDGTGALHCHSAICAHLGANIGFGGEVEGECVKCPFHGWGYDPDGTVASTPGIVGRPRTKARLSTFRVVERYGGVFVWNGLDPPDHLFPDIFEECGISPDRQYVYCRFHCPFPAKLFVENLPDAAHFSTLHGIGGWGDTEVIEETPTKIVYECRFRDLKPFFTPKNLWKLYRRGELSLLLDARQDLVTWTYGGGLQVLTLKERVDYSAEAKQRSLVARGLEFIDNVYMIFSFVPETATTHNLLFILLFPKVKVPVVGKLIERVIGSVGPRRQWAAIIQDTMIQTNREEPANPAYNKFDRALVRYRRFSDSRVLDRSLWRGDGLRTTGRRGGVDWPDAPAGDDPE